MSTEPKPEQILRDKENKIKLLFSEFESLKKKIFVCQQQRKEDAGSRHHNLDQKKTVKAQQPRLSLQPHRQDSEKELLQLKIQKYEQLLRQKSDLFEGKERYLNKALKQQKISLEMMRETYQRKLRRATKVVLPFTPEEIVGQLQLNNTAQQKLSVCEKRMSCLSQMLGELRRGVLLKLQKNAEEMDQIIRDKLSLEIELAENQERIQRLQEDLQDARVPSRSNQFMEKLGQIEIERQQETKLLHQRIKELEDELEEAASDKQRTKTQYDEGVERLELQFREELKHMSKKQQSLEQAQRVAIQTNNRLTQAQKQQNRLMEELQLDLKQCRQQLTFTTSENEQLKLKLDTLTRQSKLAVSNYESQLFTLNHQLEDSKDHTRALEEQLSESKLREQESTVRLEAKLREFKEVESMQKVNSRSNDQQVKELEIKLKGSLHELQQQKDGHQRDLTLLNERIRSLENRHQESCRRLKEKDEELSKLAASAKKSSQEQKPSGTVPIQTRKEIEKYQAQIQQLKIILEATQFQLESQDAPKETDAEMRTKLKQLSDEKSQLERKLSEKNRQLQLQDREAKKLEEAISKLEIKHRKELEEKEQAIEDLKEKKAIFEKLAIEIGHGNEELKRKMPIQNYPRKNNNERRIVGSINEINIRQANSDNEADDKSDERQRRIVSGINDIQIRQTNSDNEVDGRVSEVEQADQKSPNSRGKHANKMMYSYNLTNQRHLLQQIKELEKELELAVAEKQFLNAKKQKLEEDVNSFEVDQERFETQKQVLKQELNRLNHQLNSLKAEIKKLLTLFLVDNKKAFKGNVTVLKECFNRICNMALPPSELALPHLFSTNLEDKKGIFSIL